MSSDFRETLYTINSKGERNWVYPQIVSGFFRDRRKVVAVALLLVYCCMPWISINGLQAVHLDISHRRFVFLGTTFWATDTRFLFLTLSSLAFSLFFFTALLGRVWCGWACPQTIFLEFVFRPIERLIEGTPAQRIKLDQSPWNARKIRIKFTKYAIYAVIAWFMASTFLAYFFGRESLLQMMTQSPTENLSTFILTLVMMGVVAFEFGWFREQFCTVLCPYARFQSVLLDENSLIVGYDVSRGEPRGKINQTTGDCIDCGLCVRVCPTGIDIRNGLQLECIHCASCIDACNSVMAKINKPLGLIKYTSESSGFTHKFKILRGRTYLYGTILTILFCTFLYLLNVRSLTEVSLLHAKTATLFNRLETGEINNQLVLHLENKSNEQKLYDVKIIDEPMLSLVIPINPFPVAAESVVSAPVFVKFPEEILKKGKKKVTVEVSDGKDFTKRLTLDLLGPG